MPGGRIGKRRDRPVKQRAGAKYDGEVEDSRICGASDEDGTGGVM